MKKLNNSRFEKQELQSFHIQVSASSKHSPSETLYVNEKLFFCNANANYVRCSDDSIAFNVRACWDVFVVVQCALE